MGKSGLVCNNQVTINVQDQQVSMAFKHKIQIDEFLQVMLTATLSALTNVVSSAPKDIQAAIQEDLYDKFNVGASNLLALFAPDIEMRPTLTTEAILKAEDQLIEEAYDKMQTTQAKEEYATFIVGTVADPDLKALILKLYGPDVAADETAQVQIPMSYLKSAHEEACFDEVP